MAPSDTSRAAASIQWAVHRGMSPQQRWRRTVEMCGLTFELAAAGARRRHPEYSEDDVEWAVRRLRLGDDLFARAFPDRPRLDP